MKKYIKSLLLVLLLFITTVLISQPYMGIYGGISSSKLSGDSPDKARYKGLLGLDFGMNMDFRISKLVYLSFQPSFSQEGTRVFYNVPLEYELVDSAKIRLNYISLPVILKVSTSNKKFYAIGGAEVAYLVSTKLKTSSYQGDLDDNISDINIAVHFGAGMKIPLGLPVLFIELRYSQGIVNLTDQIYQKSFIPRVKTSGFKLNVGIEFPLSTGKK